MPQGYNRGKRASGKQANKANAGIGIIRDEYIKKQNQKN